MDRPPTGMNRRQLFELLGASAALAGMSGCMERPHGKIVPRTDQPPEQTPGVPQEYATSMVLDGYATGLVVKSLEGRPIKIEGNPEHPASLGGTTAIHQGSVLQLYDPDRARGVTSAGAPASREDLTRLLARLPTQERLWLLMLPQSSPLLAELMDEVRARHPAARFVFDAPLDRRRAYRGAQLAFGRPLELVPRLAGADVVVSLDADFMCTGHDSVRCARDFATRRRQLATGGDPGRLYVAEPSPTATGSLADERLRVPASHIGQVALELLGRLIRSGHRPRGMPDAVATQMARQAERVSQATWASAAARDLAAHPGTGLVLVGDRQPAEVHALGHLLNHMLGNLGRTAQLTAPVLIDPLGPDLATLVNAARAGSIDTLVIIEANPAYTAPDDLDLPGALARVPRTLHLGFHTDETSALCSGFVPHHHYLESWGDARAADGTRSLIQPLIRPMVSGYSTVDMLEILAGNEHPDDYGRMRRHYAAWRGIRGEDLELAWEADLKRGFSSSTALPPVTAPALDWGGGLGAALVRARAAADSIAAAARRGALELAFDASPSVHDGRFANVSWLQEMPKPATKLTWDNAALLSPATARELHLASGRVVTLQIGNRTMRAPVLVVPGHADRAVSIELGYGRLVGGHLARGVGVDAYRLWQGRDRGFAPTLAIHRTGDHHTLATTQLHWRMEGRELALETDLTTYRADPHFTREQWGEEPTLFRSLLHGTPQWAMTIDTTICSGCSACVVACQAENNVPVVGKAGVVHNREMHWLRIDTYRIGSDEQPRLVNQPMLCQHCETAPCEYVCPVYATEHSPDGLNEMIYNRCIGTRFCSNNCPYKVRRFNWFDYTSATPETLQLQHNPNVTVRQRGVMEKCSYCVQRIRMAEIDARIAKREIRPGEVMTACQQACPTGAIQFDSLHHTESEMMVRRREPRHYAVLNELGTRPRTVYLAKIYNPSGPSGGAAGGGRQG